MTPETTISLSVILSILSAIGVIFSIVMTLKKDHREDEARRIDIAEQFAKINVKLDSFCNTMTDMGRKTEKAMDKIEGLSLSINSCNERIETLFRYHEDHEKRIANLEDDK